MTSGARHIQKRIQTLLTKNPKTDGKELKEINNLFIRNRLTEQELGKTLALFCKRNYHFLSERNEENKYKHKRIIQALRCFKTNMKYLFTHQKYPDLNIPNTTNHRVSLKSIDFRVVYVDGGVNTKLKDLVRRHRGMKIERRNKLLVNLLYNLRGKS